MAYTSEVNFSTYIKARLEYTYSEVSGGHSVTVKLQLRRTNSYGYDTFQYPSSTVITIDGTSSTSSWTSSNYPKIPANNTNWQTFKSYTRTVSHSGSSTISIKGENKNMGSYLTGSVSANITLPSIATPPAAPTISASASSNSQVDITWGTTDLGTPTGTVYLYNGTSSSPSTQISSKTSTGNSTYNNTGLTANTKYYYKATATNTAGSASSSVVNATTLPAGISSITGSSLTSSSIVLTLVFASSGSALTTTAQVSSNNTNWNDTSLTNVQGTTQTYSVTGLTANTSYTRYFRVHTSAGNSGVKSFTWTTKPADITSTIASDIGETTATIAVACGASGSAVTTDLQMSTDNSTWTTVASNVQGTTVNVPLTSLTPDTSVTRYFRVHTVYGNSATATVTFTTLKIAHLYGSVGDQTKRVVKLYGSVGGQTKEIKKLYGSVNGETKLIYRA